MKVLLLKDVYKLGRAGDVKKVADGFGRNYLVPQKLAILATPDALKMADRIRGTAEEKRQALNQELGGVAAQIDKMVLTFPARASETGKLYGSVTLHMIADAIKEKTDVEISRRQIDIQPLRELGEFTVPVRLTVDLIPEVKVIVYREGEAVPVPASKIEVEQVEPEVEIEQVEPEVEVEQVELEPEVEEVDPEVEVEETPAVEE